MQMGNRHVQRCSPLIMIRETKVKTTARHHLTQVTMAITKEQTGNKSWWGSGDKGTLAHCWWECKLLQPPWKTVQKFLKKLRNRTATWLSISIFHWKSFRLFLGTYPQIPKILIWKDMFTPIFIATLFTIVKIRNNLSVHQWMIGWRRYGILLSHKIMKFCHLQQHEWT